MESKFRIGRKPLEKLEYIAVRGQSTVSTPPAILLMHGGGEFVDVSVCASPGRLRVFKDQDLQMREGSRVELICGGGGQEG